MPARASSIPVLVSLCVLCWIALAVAITPVEDEPIRPPDFVPDSVDLALGRPCPGGAPIETIVTDSVLGLSTVADSVDPSAVLASRYATTLIAARRGVVVERPDEGGLSTVLDLSENTTTIADQGLLAMAWYQDDVLLVLRTDSAGATVLSSHRRLTDGAFDAGTELLRVDQPDARHNGGGLAVTDDGEIFVGIGDGGFQGDPTGNAENPDTLLGKILRGRIDWETAGLVPAVGSDTLVWAIGVRNPHRIWLSDDDSIVWTTDVGENCREEVNRLDVAGGPYDLGWNSREGDIAFAETDSSAGRTDSSAGRTLHEPLASYDHAERRCAVIGGAPAPDHLRHLAQGAASVVADLCSGELFLVDDLGFRALPAVVESPVDVSADSSGQILIAQSDGRVRRLEP